MSTAQIHDDDGTVLAIIVRNNPDHTGVEFFTPPEWAIQVGKVAYPKGHVIPAHFHNPVPRESVGTVEVLYVLRGEGEVCVWGEGWYTPVVNLSAGDLIVINQGTKHRLTMSDDTVLLEVKSGPYLTRAVDKTIIETSDGTVPTPGREVGRV